MCGCITCVLYYVSMHVCCLLSISVCHVCDSVCISVNLHAAHMGVCVHMCVGDMLVIHINL